MKMQGYNGSQLWDTAFAVQAIVETNMVNDVAETLQRASDYIDITQVDEDVDQLDKYYRHISKGAWPFSTKDHGAFEGGGGGWSLRQHQFFSHVHACPRVSCSDLPWLSLSLCMCLRVCVLLFCVCLSFPTVHCPLIRSFL